VKLLVAAFLLIASTSAYATKLPHYVFVLPNGYTGWIQVVFEDPNGAPFEVEHDNAVLKIDDSGIIRLRGVGRMFVGSHDEFFYDVVDQHGKHSRIPVPANFVCTAMSGMDNCYDDDSKITDGFSVGRATIGKPKGTTQGSAWWLFVGPPDLRKKMARPAHVNPDPQYPYHIDVPEDDPSPGRIK